jgi:hypothetical protein
MPMTKPILLEDFRFFDQGEFSYKGLLQLHKGTEDIIVEHPQGFLFLRRQLSVPPEAVTVYPASAMKARGERLKMSSASEISLSIRGMALPVQSRYQHISFRLKAERPAEGIITCSSEQSAGEKTRFMVRSSWVHKFYVLPCPQGEVASLRLGPGDYSLEDIRFHY